MGRLPYSGRVDIAGLFHHVQDEMLAHLSAGRIIEQPTACGALTEQHWLEFFNRYLPERYRASSAFIVDSTGARSRQIDIAIYDRLYSPLLFPHDAGLHIPAESVYAVFEVKQDLNQRLIRDAGRKAASVRLLRRTSVPIIAAGRRRPAIHLPRILAGILALRAGWPGRRFSCRLASALRVLTPPERLDLGIALQQGAFECRGRYLHVSDPAGALIDFMLSLLGRLRDLGTAPALNIHAYARTLSSRPPIDLESHRR